MDLYNSNQSREGSVNSDVPLETFNATFASGLSPTIYNDNSDTNNSSIQDNTIAGKSKPEPLQTAPINSIPDSSSHQRNASMESVSWKDTDSILNSLNRKNKNLTPVFTRDYVGATTASETLRKGWKGLSSLEKSLSVSLGVVSVLSLALMIAVIVVGVQLNKECQLVPQTTETTCAPNVGPMPTLPPDLTCNTNRSRPLKPGEVTTQIPVTTDQTVDPSSTQDPIASTELPDPLIVGDEVDFSETETANAIRESPSMALYDANVQASGSCFVTSESDTFSTCLTPSCTRMASDVLESIDSDTNPCLNFYQFACGGRIKNNPVVPILDQKRKLQTKLLWEIKGILEAGNIASHSQPSRSLHLAQQYYHSCMNPLHDDGVAVAELRLLLDSMTGLSSPLSVSTDSHGSEDTLSSKMASISKRLASIRRFLNGNYIVRVNVEADDMNSTENAIYLSHPDVGLLSLLHQLGIDPRENDIVSGLVSSDAGEVSSQQKTPQLSYFYQTIVNQLWSHVYPEDAGNLVGILNQVETFNEELEKISTDGAMQDSLLVDYNSLNETSPGELSPSMRMWLLNLTKEVIKDESQIPEDIFEDNEREKETTDSPRATPTVVVKNIKYFQGLERILNDTEDEVIERYLKFRILLDYAPHAGTVFVDMIRDFSRKAGVQNEYLLSPRWETCARETNKYFGWTISNALIHTPKTRNALEIVRKQITETASYLLEVLNETLSTRAPWISSDETRQVALRKLEEMETFLGFPSEWAIARHPNNTNNEDTHSPENTFVEGFYSDMNFTDALNYMQNFVEAGIWPGRKELEQLYSTKHHNRLFDPKWPLFVYPTNLEAVFLEKLNYLVLPIGVTDITATEHVPYINIPSVQYGTVGVLGAELMLRGFDEKGSYRSASGNVDPWWDVTTRENFKNISNCFRDQYFNDGIASVEGKQNEFVISQRSKELRKLILQNGALALAYQVFQANTFDLENVAYRLPGLQEYPPEKLFFLSYAQSQCSPTSLPSTRENFVNNVVGNSVDFAEHWECPLPEETNVCKLF